MILILQTIREIAATIAYNCTSVTVMKVQRHRGEVSCGCNYVTASLMVQHHHAFIVIPISLSPPSLSFSLSVAVIILCVERMKGRERMKEKERRYKGKRVKERKKRRHCARVKERQPDGGERVA